MPVKYRILPEVSPQDRERFWASVDIRSPDECWPWLAGKSVKRGNYGRFYIRRVSYRTNRVAYFLSYGVDPGPDDACHTCDNPPCCNPAHLFKGTRAVNLADMKSKGRAATGDKHFTKRYPERIARGNALPQSKLTADKVLAIRARYVAGGVSQNQLAAEYGVGQNSIWHILHRKSWTHV